MIIRAMQRWFARVSLGVCVCVCNAFTYEHIKLEKSLFLENKHTHHKFCAPTVKGNLVSLGMRHKIWIHLCPAPLATSIVASPIASSKCDQTQILPYNWLCYSCFLFSMAYSLQLHFTFVRLTYSCHTSMCGTFTRTSRRSLVYITELR